MRRYTVDVPVDASGDGTAYSPIVRGAVQAIVYVPDGTSPYDNTADFTITGKESGIAVLSASNVAAGATYAPRLATASVANVAALYAAAGTAVLDRVPVADEAVKFVVAQGGASKTGRFHIYLTD